MRETKIRFGDRTWALIQEESEREGVSASQFVREAAMIRASFARLRRGDPEATAYAEALAMVSELKSERVSD